MLLPGVIGWQAVLLFVVLVECSEFIPVETELGVEVCIRNLKTGHGGLTAYRISGIETSMCCDP